MAGAVLGFVVSGMILLHTAGADPQSPLQVRLFAVGQAGVHTYRIPALAVSIKGTLLAFCEARKYSSSDYGEIHIVLRRSIDNGLSWEPIQPVVKDGGNTCGNPCPIVDRRTGAIVLLFCKNKGTENQHQIVRGEAASRTVWLTTSRDDGLTWSKPHEISAQVRKPDWRWYATGPGHGIQLSGGRLVAACDHGTGPRAEEMHSHAIYSDDGGRSWKLGGVAEAHTDESTVVELTDGSLYLNMRSYRGHHCRAYACSHDRGATWSLAADDASLVEPVCQASVLRLSTVGTGGKSSMLFSNPASTRRENLSVRLSYDECKSWPVTRTLWPGPSAYSDLAATVDGAIGCLFECGEKGPTESIVFERFSLEWLTAGVDQ